MTTKVTTVRPSKISQQKLYEYIKKVEVDGLPRVRAYAEAIDPNIYERTPAAMKQAFDYLKTSRPDFEEIKEMVLAEQQDWNLRRSAAIQDKAMTLLGNLIDKANSLAADPDTNVKDLNVAVSTLKAIMPALTAQPKTTSDSGSNKKARAARFINVLICAIIGSWITLNSVL